MKERYLYLMRIDKISENSAVNRISKTVSERVFLKSQPDVFVKSGRETLSEKSFASKFKGFIETLQSTVEKNFKFKSLNNIDDLVKEISQKYPGMKIEDIEAFLKKAFLEKRNPQKVLNILENTSGNLANLYRENVPKIEKDVLENFGNLISVEDIGVRSKSRGSIVSKLINKFTQGKLETVQMPAIASKIGDGYGIRVLLREMSPNLSKEIINKTFKGKISYDKFVQKVSNFENLSAEEKQVVQKGLDKLKEMQTNEVLHKFLKLLQKGEIQLADDEFNNYGSELTSYFTDEQLRKIAKIYEQKTHKPLAIVSKTDLNNVYKNAEKVSLDDVDISKTVSTNTNKAVKKSGYSAVQANLKTKYTTGELLADTEIQVRGSKVNTFAEFEHVPYDIRKGKNTDPEFNEIKNIMLGMSEESYNKYEEYLANTYKHYRLEELGLLTEKPQVPKNLKWADLDKLPDELKDKVKAGDLIDSSLIDKISEKGLSTLHSGKSFKRGRI